MNATLRDRLLGLLLAVAAGAWSMIVYLTIPAGGDSAIGPQAFPLFLGLVLLVLSLLLLFRSIGGSQRTAAPESEDVVDMQETEISASELRVATSLFLILIAYGLLMERFGFLLATPLVIAVTLSGVLGQRRPIFVGGLAVAITAGCWIVFGELLGVYLPHGSWISSRLHL